MRKQSKIISLILVLALLLSMLVLPGVTAAADTSVTGTESGSESGTANQAESFTPSATWTENYSSIPVKSDVSGNLVTSVGLGNWVTTDTYSQTLYNHVVTVGDNQYGVMTPFAEKSSANHFVSVNATSTQISDGTTAVKGYYVIDIDLATDSDYVQNVTLTPLIRSISAADKTEFLDRESDHIHKFLPNDGNWHHVTLVGDMVNNVLYEFVNGELVRSSATAYASGSWSKANPANVTGLRINMAGSVELGTNTSLAYDNIAVRVFDNNDAIASALASGKLGGYDNVISAPAEEKLPALASVNGVEYSNVNIPELAYISGLDVKLLREYAGSIYFGANTTVETNGLSFVQGTNYTVADGATVTQNGTVVTVSGIPFVGSYAQNEETTNATVALNNSTADSDENIIDTLGVTGFSAETAQLYVVKAAGYDDTYIEIRPGASHNTASEAHAYINYTMAGTKPYYAAGSYMVMDLDVYSDSGFINAWIGTTSRNEAGTNAGAGAFFLDNIGLTPGRWNHITVISSVDSNTARVYVDGAYTYTFSNAFCSTSYTSTGVYFDGVRFNIRNSSSDTITEDESLAIDNVAVRINVADDEVKSCWSSDGIADWRGITEGAPIPTLATVDGVPYYSTAALNEILSVISVEPRDVVFYREHLGTVTVGCDAVINTNGLNLNLGYLEGGSETTEGNIITVDAPYKQSSASVNTADVNTIIGATFASDVPDNLYTKFTAFSKIVAAGTTEAYTQSSIQTNNYTGDTYWILNGEYVTSASNSYIDFGTNMIISYDANAYQYFIYDFDMAALSAVGDFALSTVTRGGSGNSFASGWTVNSHKGRTVAERGEMGYFQHVTIVQDVNNNKSHMYINGNLIESLSVGFAQADFHTQFLAGTLQLKADGIRLSSNSKMDVAFDNMAVRYVNGATDYSADFASGDLGNFAVYTDDYVLPEIAPIAFVDGESIPNEDALVNVIAGKEYGTETQVIITSDFTGTATVSSSALVNTNGHTHGLVAGDGVIVTDLGNNKLSYYAPSLSTEVQYSATNILSAIKYAASDNVFSSINYQCANSETSAMYKGYLATDKVTGNKYAMLGNDGYDGTTNSYFEPQGITKFYYDAAKSQYRVYDFDVAIETDASVSFEAVARNADATESPDNISGTPISTLLTGYAKGDFQHITHVVDIDNNQAYTFVNGVLYTTAKAHKDGAHERYLAKTDYIQCDGVRIGSKTLGKFAVDNVYIRNVEVQKTDTSADSLTAAVSARDITKWSGAVTAISNHVAPIGSVDGDLHYVAETMSAALADGKEHNSEIMRKISATVKVGSIGTVTNRVGVALAAAYGYRMTDNGDSTYTFTIETRQGTVTINVNSSTLYSLSVLYGTDIYEYLVDNGIIDNAILFDKDGGIYTGWENSFGTVEGDVTYDLTATKCESNFIVLVNGVVSTAYADSEEGFFAAIAKNESSVIYLNKDMTITVGKVSGSFNGNHSIRLNGHTITTAVIDSYSVDKENSDGTVTTTVYTPKNNPNHMFSIGGVSGNLEFVGPGVLNDCSRENTTQFIFAGYAYTGTVYFKDMDIVSTNSLATMRGGNLVLENVNIDYIMAQGSVFLQMGEEYNGSYSTNNAYASFINCVVNARHYRDCRGKFIHIKDVPSTPSIVYTVNFIDSVMNIGFANEYAIHSDNANTVINIIGSEIRSNNLFDHGYTDSSGNNIVFVGTVNVGEGSKFANASNLDYDFVKIDDGLELVNTGDLTAPYMYTSEYATVKWSDGSTSLWADGTYPVNENCPLDNVEKVVAGGEYTFASINALGFSVKANLTLTSGIQFNLYIPKSAAVTAINIGGIDYSIEGAGIVAIDGVEYRVFEYDILPSEAAGTFTFAISTADWTVAREMSVVDYASIVYASVPSAKGLMSNILKYIYEAHAYSAIYSENLGAILDALSSNPSSNVAPAIKESDTTAINGVIESASINVQSTLKFRFNLVAGADISDLTFTVDGKTVEYTVGDGYVEIELRAHDMLKDITIKVGENVGNYNLYAYYNHIITAAAGIVSAPQQGNDNYAAKAYKVQSLVKALCSYVAAATDYNG